MFNIHCAAYLGAYECVDSSVQCGALDQLNSEGWSPLMYACSSRHLPVIDLLLKSGAGVDVPGTEGLTPLMIASRMGAIDVAKYLLQHMKHIEVGINFADAKGWTALFHAVYMGQEDTVRFLLSNGAKVNITDKKKQNILMVAARVSEMKPTNVLKILADAGAEYMSPGREASLIAEKYDCLPDLLSLFRFLDVEKYYRIFHDRNIGIKQFLMLTEDDLRVLGIKCLGPRRKMSLAIYQLGNKFHIKSQME